MLLSPSAPERIAYVDDDPLMLSHARALLTGIPQGARDYIGADVRDSGKILRGAASTLDLARPATIAMLGSENIDMDPGEARTVVHQLLDGVRLGVTWPSPIPPPRSTPSR
jgi:hypothetical protein